MCEKWESLMNNSSNIFLACKQRNAFFCLRVWGCSPLKVSHLNSVYVPEAMKLSRQSKEYSCLVFRTVTLQQEGTQFKSRLGLFCGLFALLWSSCAYVGFLLLLFPTVLRYAYFRKDIIYTSVLLIKLFSWGNLKRNPSCCITIECGVKLSFF